MAITNYTELQTALTSWSHRSDLTTVIPDFIRNAELRMERDLRVSGMETSATITATGTASLSLPTDFLELRRIYSNASPVKVLEYLTPDVFWNNYNSNQTGETKNFTIEAGQIVTGDIASQDLKIVYYAKIPDLATNTTNWLLTDYPDLYLYASLCELNKYTGDNEGVQKYDGLYSQALQSFSKSDKGRWSGNVLRVVAA